MSRETLHAFMVRFAKVMHASIGDLAIDIELNAKNLKNVIALDCGDIQVAGKTCKPQCVVMSKAEWYSEVKDPRLISVVREDINLELGFYVRALDKALSTSPLTPWYLPGRKDFNFEKDYVDADVSRNDGSHTRDIRMLEVIIFQQFFGLAGAKAVLREIDAPFTLVDSNDYRYTVPVFGKRKSGSTITTLGNTGVHGFLKWLFNVHVLGMSDVTAFREIEPCYGDDQKKRYSDYERYFKFVRNFGFVVELEKPSITGLKKFCGRLWDGNRSIPDPERVLYKLGSCVSSYGPIMGYVNKFAGMYHADYHPPIIEPLALWALNKAPKAETHEYNFTSDKFLTRNETWDCWSHFIPRHKLEYAHNRVVELCSIYGNDVDNAIPAILEVLHGLHTEDLKVQHHCYYSDVLGNVGNVTREFKIVNLTRTIEQDKASIAYWQQFYPDIKSLDNKHLRSLQKFCSEFSKLGLNFGRSIPTPSSSKAEGETKVKVKPTNSSNGKTLKNSRSRNYKTQKSKDPAGKNSPDAGRT
jgi:hypothetical protein